MRAMRLHRLGPIGRDSSALVDESVPDPVPGAGELLLRVTVCGVCHTELDEVEGRTPPPELPVIPGHQVVGRVVAFGDGVDGITIGDRMGVAWIFSACGACGRCAAGQENLCADFRATGRDADGGYAELMVVAADFAHPIPDELDDRTAAPLLCAGAIGYRSLRLTGIRDCQRLGLTGFGASGHLVLQMARHLYPGTDVAVFARNADQREFARELGASWTGETESSPPERLDAIIDTTPAWAPVVEALGNLAPGGRLVINAIRKTDHDQRALAALDYAEHLWLEREIKSVANITRADVRGSLDLAVEAGISPEVTEYPLAEANRALRDLAAGGGRGGRVLRIGE